MRHSRTQQSLSYDVRLPDDGQVDALRLLAASRQVVNTLLIQLWPLLDEFGGEHRDPAWKQVVSLTASPDPHGDRQFRCEAETVGRILRAQAARKQIFLLIQPILTEGFIRPKTEHHRAGKVRQSIKTAIQALRTRLRADEDEEASFIALQSVVEQACNYFLAHGEFPATYEDMQAIPLLKVGLLTYAGDDGGAKGQAYRFALDVEHNTASLRFRSPDETGRWRWRIEPVVLPLPECVVTRLKEGAVLAPTLRELVKADGEHIAVLDVILQVPKSPLAQWKDIEHVLGFDWGVHTLATAVVLGIDLEGTAEPIQLSRPLFVRTSELDGHQARTRRQIDELTAKQATCPPDSSQWQLYDGEIGRCWRIYHARHHELAHLAANLLILFATVWECSLISGESLTTLKSTGRGKGARGRWRNWRNNTTIRSEIWQILRYKCHLLGLRFRSEQARGTSHTCPRCGIAAHTYRSPRTAHRTDPVTWGRWLVCAQCGYNADRDYCAALNLERLGIAYLVARQTMAAHVTRERLSYAVTDGESVKPCRYRPHGAVLLFPPPTPRSRLLWEGKCYCNGWKKSCTVHSSYPAEHMFRLCG